MIIWRIESIPFDDKPRWTQKIPCSYFQVVSTYQNGLSSASFLAGWRRNQSLLPTPLSRPSFLFSSMIISFQKALLDPIHSTLKETSKHLRKKRQSLKAPKANSSMINSFVGLPKSLGFSGWCVRYDFKMAVLAEMRGDWDVALKWVSLSLFLLSEGSEGWDWENW